MIFQAWTHLFFFFFLSVYTVTPPPDVPHCGRLWGTCKKAYRQPQTDTHTHTHTQTHTHTLTDHLRAGGTSADLLRNKPRAMIAEIRRRSNCMLLLSRVKYCWQKACVCVCVCLCVWGGREEKEEKHLGKENVFGNHRQCTICTRRGVWATLDYCCEELLHCY